MAQITFNDVVKLVDQLSEQECLSHSLTAAEHDDNRVTALARAVAAMREGLSMSELDEMEWVMNYEFKRKDDSA